MSRAIGRMVSRNGEGREDIAHDALQWPPGPDEAAQVLDLSGQRANCSEPAGSINAPAGSIILGDPATTPERERPPLRAEAARHAKPAPLRSSGGLRDHIWPSFGRAGDALTRWSTTRYLGLAMLGVVALGTAVFLARGVLWRPGTAAPPVAAASARPESDVGTAGKSGIETTGKSGLAARGVADASSTIDYAASPGRLSVETQPAGAAVLVDGTRRGLSPISVTGLTAGNHEVLIRTRHGELRQRVRLAAGESVSVVVPLAAVPTSAPPPVASRAADASLVVRAPVELRIFEGEQLLGTSAMQRVGLTAGSHALTLKNDDSRLRGGAHGLRLTGKANGLDGPDACSTGGGERDAMGGSLG